MSNCISSHGEYSDHEPDAQFCCQRCCAFDESAALARIRELGVHSDRLRAECDRTRHRFDVERARAEEAEAKLAAVRAIVEAPPPMFGRPLDQWVDDLLVSLRAALDGAVTDE